MADLRQGGHAVVGDTEHGGTEPSAPRPVLGGATAVAHGASPTAVTAGTRVRAIANRHGVPFAVGGHPNVVSREFRATSAKTNTDMLGAISSGQKVVVTEIEVLNANGSAATSVRIGFGASAVPSQPSDGGNVAGIVLSHPSVAPGSGVVRGTGGGILAVGGDGEELRVTCGNPSPGELAVLVSYFIIES